MGADRQSRLAAVASVLVIGLVALFPAARGADSSIAGFVLDNAGTLGAPGALNSESIVDQIFAAFQINAEPNIGTGKYDLRGDATNTPLFQTGYLDGSGSGSLRMTGTYDPTENAVAGTFTMNGSTSGTWATGPSSSQPYESTLTFTGDVTGSIDNSIAELSFDGPFKLTCSVEGCPGMDDSRGISVWFDVSSGIYSTVPGSSPTPAQGYVWAATGDAYYSPADQKDLEPSQRTWVAIKPGDRLYFGDGAMLRTGRRGSLNVGLSAGARFRLQPSTLLSFERRDVTTPASVMLGRLINGIIDFYETPDTIPGTDVATRRARVTMKGTIYQVAETDNATVVTVIEGLVTVTDTSTDQSVDVGPYERATVDDSGLTKVADPAASMLPEEAEMVLPADASPDASEDPAAAPDTSAAPTAGPAESAIESGAGGLPIALLAGIGVLVVLAIAAFAFLVLRSRSGPRQQTRN
jgi:hypothetical protein